MNLNRLHTFIAVVEAGSISRAGKLLGISQPGVSQHIKHLEDEFGVQLLERTATGVVLTREGSLVYEHARTIVKEWQALQRSVRPQHTAAAGQLRIGASSIPSTYFLPEFIYRFRNTYTQVNVTMEVGESRGIIEHVKEQVIDIGAVGSARHDEDTLLYRPFAYDQLVLIAACGHPWTQSEAIGPRDILGERFVARQPGSGTRDTIEAGLGRWGFTYACLRVVAELGSTEAVIGAVEAGIGVSLVSRFAALPALALRRICTVEIDGEPLTRELYLVTRRDDANPLTQAFCEIALQHQST